MAKKLHYSKAALVKEYQKTFKGMVLLTTVAVFLGVAYFFAMSTYLGSTGHTKHKPYFDRFVADERIDGNFDGLKLKDYEKVDAEANAEYYEKKPHVKGDSGHH